MTGGAFPFELPAGELDYVLAHAVCRLEDRQSAPPLTGKQLDALEDLDRRIERAELDLVLTGNAYVERRRVTCPACCDTGVRDEIGYCRDCERRA